MIEKARALTVENMVHGKQIESLHAAFEGACLAGNGRLAEVHRSQMHTVLDHILDNKAAICTISLLLTNS